MTTLQATVEYDGMVDARLKPVALFTGAYLLAAVVAAFARGNLEFVFYIAVMALLIVVVLQVDRHVQLTTATLWCLSIWGLLHMSGGLVHVPAGWPVNGDSDVLYNLWLFPGRLKFDQAVHAWGFGVATWVCWQGIQAALRGQGSHPVRPTAGLLVLAAAAGMGLGAVNEVVEFAAVLLLPNTNVGGYMNTGWDLVANLVGCIVAVVLIYISDRK